ncbi:MAG: dihydroneopterin aldolase [Reichenbachiella sp.]
MLIRLEGLEFFAHHGFYEEEQKIGNKYTVDIVIKLASNSDFSDDNLDDTINYEVVYEIINEIMRTPTKLLETLASRINRDISLKFPDIDSTTTTVSKHNPPIKGICAKASVTLEQTL